MIDIKPDAWNAWIRDDVTQHVIKEIRQFYTSNIEQVADQMGELKQPLVESGRIQALRDVLSIFKLTNEDAIVTQEEDEEFTDPARVDDPSAGFSSTLQYAQQGDYNHE